MLKLIVFFRFRGTDDAGFWVVEIPRLVEPDQLDERSNDRNPKSNLFRSWNLILAILSLSRNPFILSSPLLRKPFCSRNPFSFLSPLLPRKIFLFLQSNKHPILVLLPFLEYRRFSNSLLNSLSCKKKR